MIRTFALGLAAWAVVGAAHAQQTPPAEDPPETAVDDVVVDGRSVRAIARGFVAEALRAPRGDNLARWHDEVCVGVVNLDPRHAQYLVDQISAVAMVVGLEVGEPGCRPRVLILADSDGDRLASWLVEDSPRTFRPDIGGSNLGRDALARFQTSGAPVRWWHVTQSLSADTGVPGATVRASDVPRIRSAVEEGFHTTIVILDTSRIGSINFASLADYVSMIVLSQVDDNADMSRYDTVLNLFQTAGGPSVSTQRMTDWDLDILRGLYSARGDGAQQVRQIREIGYEVERARERERRAQAGSED